MPTGRQCRPVMHPDLRKDSARVERAWRELTFGSSCALLACSGGADSSALALTLAPLGGRLIIAHVVHDLRPEPDRSADRDAARKLAEKLDLAFIQTSVSPGRETVARGNVEDAARRLRYQALATLARDQGCDVVATAHHADDVLETLLMSLVRGTGPAGLRGPAPSRELGPGVRLVRPMLGVDRAFGRGVCRAWGWTWQDDATNNDLDRTRARIRAEVAPALTALRAGASRRAARGAELVRQAHVLVSREREALWGMRDHQGDTLSWSRPALVGRLDVVVGDLIRHSARVLGCRMDGVSGDALARAVRAVTTEMDAGRGERAHRVGELVVLVGAKRVEVRRAKEAEQ